MPAQEEPAPPEGGHVSDDVWWRRPEALLAGFLLVFVASALVGQSRSPTPAWEEGAPIEAFTSGLLWILAMFGLVRAVQAFETGRRIVFWLAFTAGTGALAVDEIVGVHESTEPSFNDDWVKVVLWVATPIILVILARFEDAPPLARIGMAIGYAFHTAYLVVELGDGEIFALPFASDTLKNAEELFELLFLASYTFALWLGALRTRRHVGSSTEAR